MGYGRFIKICPYLPEVIRKTTSPAIAEKAARSCMIWNSRASCWQWLFQAWNF